MRTFYYVHTGHRVGLDRFHRAASIVRQIQEITDITLLCSDYRIAGEARNYGIKRAVGVDVVRNIPQIAQNGDRIIFDSDEVNPVLLEDMIRYFSTFIRISDKFEETLHADEYLISPYLHGERIYTGVIVDEHYFEPCTKTIPMALFFGDDDYEKDLEKIQSLFAPYKMDLLMGYYHFLGYERELKESFQTIYESEEYEKVVRETEILVTSSPQAVLQSLAGGGKPVYIQRQDYADDFIELFKTFNIPVIEELAPENLAAAVNLAPSNNYHKISKSGGKEIDFIRETFNL